MRTKKELLQILLDNIGRLKTGLCLLASNLMQADVVTLEEWNVISNHISDYWFYANTKVGGYYWEKGNKEIRAEWLKEQIENEGRNG